MKGLDPIDEVLAGGHLPARAHDEIFERVLAAVEARPRRLPWWRRRWALVPAGTLAAALGGWLLSFRAARDGFSAKGDARLMEATGIAIACKSLAARCRVGDTMIFMVSPAVRTGYLVAYAQRVDEPNGERIWYFPDAAGRSPFVTGDGSTRVLDEGVKVGAEHRQGKYRVTLWLARSAIARGAPALASQAAQSTRTSVDLEIVP
jgi:hypothetical protein